MQQSKVVFWMCALMGLNRLLEAGYHRLKGLLLVEPMGKKMHTHIRQMRRDVDQRTASGGAACRVAGASLRPITLPCSSQPMKMAHAHRNRSLHVGDRVKQDPGRALRVFVQSFPQEGFVNVTQLSAHTKGWMGILRKGTLAGGEVHD